MTMRRLVIGLALAALWAGSLTTTATARTAGCEAKSYSYAGLLGDQVTSGVAATLVAKAPQVISGHVAGWVNMSVERSRWLQVGLNSTDSDPNVDNLYTEVKHVGQAPRYIQLGQVPFGQAVRVAITALKKPGWWQVSVDSRPRGDYYVGTGLRPSVLAEDWQGRGSSCNSLSYSFRRARVFSPSGWTMQGLEPYVNPGFTVKRGHDWFHVDGSNG